ncbi:MAG: tryptophan--tRNA ligase [Gammaproteobacteria bacterium]|jgi:tryptophanyl-tRNA synthetase|nr:tryptophan--tRNA ligase [Gammaproteobacteria bacterium]MDC0923841.1 tryptophan--tRNA ligase [Gammaproteobacteria bacterium]|tara:strand:- start:845 stop:1837 length:993 start_codon:yes stop_codon:yes gene_type:complete
MKKRILTGITTTGTPHIGNYLGAIKPALELAKEYDESFYFLADYHAIIKNSKSTEVTDSVKNVALAWLASGLNPNKSFFYRQSDVPEILELSWVLNCVTAKGLMNRSHAYKAATTLNKDDEDKGITMGLFSYPILMAADILMFNATHVPVGADQIQHIEMTRDIAGRFNHLYKKTFILPEAIIQSTNETVPGIDGQKMSKSYGNIIPLLSTEKQLKKSIAKIVTNSLEPGDPKDPSNCTVFALYKYFASKPMVDELCDDYKKGISWGDAKNKLFEVVNNEITPIRESYEKLQEDKDFINDLLSDGSNKVRPIAKELLDSIRSSVGINKIS